VTLIQAAERLRTVEKTRISSFSFGAFAL
jgi:hypothetical protein